MSSLSLFCVNRVVASRGCAVRVVCELSEGEHSLNREDMCWRVWDVFREYLLGRDDVEYFRMDVDVLTSDFRSWYDLVKELWGLVGITDVEVFERFWGRQRKLERVEVHGYHSREVNVEVVFWEKYGEMLRKVGPGFHGVDLEEPWGVMDAVIFNSSAASGGT
mmetsp:Transcript_72432/g.151274  ORF Transcript_72432/g.151274 Transcript_72432/m.151274 type:complete len:163 (-) Transcript_72432:62-550(-)|eukprot:CAMPEP_0181288320 /NCGR_PEP_ID=MMETSP1101-20121128/269_1 /TAXON_ID=46948 /ORGANISM="Rhodomonas abbreviata, Strain Caron Lab Isolate" /LENGTH=162 /DNA_ID=CAMNT_0023392433 /DNA_START=32 /DNA_END=520 /DNA_ORIENTATION=+